MKLSNSEASGQSYMQTPAWRRIVEILLGWCVLTRRLPMEVGGGHLVVSARVGGLKYLFKPAGAWDRALLAAARRLVNKGDMVWDVGANVGLFSRAASHLAGKSGAVLAIEADLDAVALLKRTARLAAMDARCAEITVLPTAISGECGVVKFNIAKRARAANAIYGLGSSQTGGVLETRLLPCLSLDALLAHVRAPQVLKIDVEGAEVAVLLGAQRVLREAVPVIYCEVQDYTRAQVYELLQECGYCLFDGDHLGEESLRPASNETHNVIALPASRCGGELRDA